MTVVELAPRFNEQSREFIVRGVKSLRDAMKARGVPKLGKKLWASRRSPKVTSVSASNFGDHFRVIANHQPKFLDPN